MRSCISEIRADKFGTVTIDEVRLANARRLADSIGGLAEFARKIGRSDSQVSQFMGENPTRNIGPGIARDIEDAFRLPRGKLDTPPPRYSETVLAAADELQLRDGDSQIYILELIRKIPRVSEPPPREPSALAASAKPTKKRSKNK